MACIRAAGLTKSYGGTAAVDGVSLSVEPGRVFGFLGPNGAGKSTMIKMLTTLVRPDSGSIEILGIDAVAEPLRVRRRIGVVLQQPSYEPTLSVENALEKYGMMWGVPRDERKRRAARLMDEFGLGDIKHKRNEDLSIGQRRRVQVAREFMHEMDLLFLDEPTVGLDPSARRDLLDYLKERTGGGLTIFYTTHILTEAEYLCDEIAVIDGGRIYTTGTPDELRRRFGSGRTVRLRLDTEAPGLAARLSGIPGCEALPGGTVVIRSESPEEALRLVLGALDGSGAKIEEISAEPETLEDAFLRMMRKDAPGS